MPWKEDTVPQRQSNYKGVADIYYSANVIVNGREVGLWNTANKSATFKVTLPPGIQVVEIDQTTYNATVANNPKPDPTNVGGLAIPGAAEMPQSGQVINNSTASGAVNSSPSGVFTDAVAGAGVGTLVANIGTVMREALMPNKPWKSQNPGTDGTGRNGPKLTDPPPNAPNKENIIQLYNDAGFASVANDGVHWCAAFVSSMLKRAGLPYIKTLSARDYTQAANKWTGATWADPKNPSTWRYNDVMVIGGHVCFVRGYDPGTNNMLLAGGNQGQDANEITWNGATYFNKVVSVGRNWPDPGGQLPSTGGGKALTKVATHGGSNA